MKNEMQNEITDIINRNTNPDTLFNKEQIIELGITVVDVVVHTFKSRTCKNCAHFNPSEADIEEGSGIDWITCDLMYIEGNLSDFSCSNYQKKEML